MTLSQRTAARAFTRVTTTRRSLPEPSACSHISMRHATSQHRQADTIAAQQQLKHCCIVSGSKRTGPWQRSSPCSAARLQPAFFLLCMSVHQQQLTELPAALIGMYGIGQVPVDDALPAHAAQLQRQRGQMCVTQTQGTQHAVLQCASASEVCAAFLKSLQVSRQMPEGMRTARHSGAAECHVAGLKVMLLLRALQADYHWLLAARLSECRITLAPGDGVNPGAHITGAHHCEAVACIQSDVLLWTTSTASGLELDAERHGRSGRKGVLFVRCPGPTTPERQVAGLELDADVAGGAHTARRRLHDDVRLVLRPAPPRVRACGEHLACQHALCAWSGMSLLL